MAGVRQITRRHRHFFPAWLAAAALFFLLLNPSGEATSSLPDSVIPCQPCHGQAGRGQIGEWLTSPFGENEGGRGCTDCHGRRCSGNSDSRFLAARRAIPDLQRLREALLLRISASCSGRAVGAEVAVSNVGAGHGLPSAAGGRTLVLEVDARNGDRSLPPWPVGATRLRLPPYATEVSRYRFVSPRGGPVHISARLLLAPAQRPPLEITNAATTCLSTGERP
jgi:hypothetical protein